METTIGGLQLHFARLFGRRNMIVDNSQADRISVFLYEIGRLTSAFRKGESLPKRLAMIFSFFMGMANYYHGEVQIARGMAAKFPLSGCAYCAQIPCRCQDNARPAPDTTKASAEQLSWTLRRWQNHLEDLYGSGNHQRGMEVVFNRLTAEASELAALHIRAKNTPLYPNRFLEECELELADILSWILAVAYVQGIDLEAEILARYEFCKPCGLIPCNCALSFNDLDAQTTTTIGRNRGH